MKMTCQDCGGSGSIGMRADEKQPCPWCGGSGRKEVAAPASNASPEKEDWNLGFAIVGIVVAVLWNWLEARRWGEGMPFYQTLFASGIAFYVFGRYYKIGLLLGVAVLLNWLGLF